MKLTKGTIILQMISQAPQQFVERTGYISECGRYGFHKDGARWIATDISSGMRICKKLTRKACAEFCETYKGKIVAAKGSAQYHEAVRNMVNYKNNKI